MKGRKMTKPSFEKADNHTIRIVVETKDDVPLTFILEQKRQLEAQKQEITGQYEAQIKQIENALVNIKEILEEANKLGITPEPPKQEEKK